MYFEVSIIILSFFLLYTVPCFSLVSKYFEEKGVIFNLYLGTILSLLLVTISAYLLAIMSMFSMYNLLSFHIFLIVIINIFVFKKNGFVSIKFNFSQPHFFLCLAIIIGFWMRFHHPWSNIQLSAPDSYEHFAMAESIINGQLIGGGSEADETDQRGLHVITALISYFSGADLYTTARFMGSLLGTFSIVGLYCLVTSLKNEDAGSFASLLYSGFYVDGVNFAVRCCGITDRY